MPDDIPADIPARMAGLPVCPRRGLPVPFVTAQTADGHPDFATLDSSRVYETAIRRLCGICGQPLDYWIAFLGGPRCVRQRAYVDPPMHEECAAASVRLCPYIARQDMQRRRTPASGAGVPPGFVVTEPEVFLRYVTHSYNHVVTSEGIVFHPAPAVWLEAYDYDRGWFVPVHLS